MNERMIQKWYEVLQRLKRAGVKYAELMAESIVRGHGKSGLAMAAIMEVRGIRNWNSDLWLEWRKAGDVSDLLLELRLFIAVFTGESDVTNCGLHSGRYERAAEIFKGYLDEAEGILSQFPQMDYDEEALLDVIRAGMRGDLYALSIPSGRRGGYYMGQNAGADVEVSRSSNFYQIDTEFLLGLVMLIHTEKGNFDVLHFCTSVDFEWVREHRPEVVEVDFLLGLGNFRYRPATDQVYGTKETRVFQQTVLEEKDAAAPSDMIEAQQQFLNWLFTVTKEGADRVVGLDPAVCGLLGHNREQIKLARESAIELPDIYCFMKSDRAIRAWYEGILQGIARFGDLVSIEVLRFPNVRETAEPAAMSVEEPVEPELEPEFEHELVDMVREADKVLVGNTGKISRRLKSGTKRRERLKLEDDSALGDEFLDTIPVKPRRRTPRAAQ